MRRDDFARFINEKTNIPPREVRYELDECLDWITMALQEDPELRLVHFGTFQVQDRPVKRVTDPTTMSLPPDQRKFMLTHGGKKIVFKPASDWAKKVLEPENNEENTGDDEDQDS